MKRNYLFFLFFFIFFCISYNSQEGFKESFLDSVLIQKKYRFKSKIFEQSLSFFIEKQWDSVLVFSAKRSSISETEVKDYFHYIRGFSFKQKKLSKESQKEFRKISSEFEFNELVKMHLGYLALELGMYDESILNYRQLLNLSNDKYKYISRSDVLTNLGLCYLHIKEYSEAEFYLKQYLELKKKIKDTFNIIKANTNLANLYYNQYKDDIAIPYFQRAYKLSKITNGFQNKRDAALNMAVVEENLKNYKKALAYRKEAEQWKDSLNNQNKIYEVAQLEKQFAVKQKQQEVDLLHVENKAKEVERNGLLYSALTLLILLCVTFYFYKEKNKTNKIIVAQKERLNELNASKDKLFSIVSHDLRASVNALKTSNVKLVDNLEAKNLDALDELLQRNSGIVNGAYNLLDNLLHWALLQTKQSYFYIEPLRLFYIVQQVAYNYQPIIEDKGFVFHNAVDKTARVNADQESLKIILRNLLDNAIKFSNAGGQIKIYTTTDQNFCNLIVEDTGVGMGEATITTLLSESPALAKKEHEAITGTGLGIQLCKSYVKKNKGVFSIESTLGKGTKMIVSLPKTT